MPPLTGLDEAIAALRGISARIVAVTPVAIETGQALVEGEARAALSRYSHQPRTPTPAPAGGPPALITGRLRSSFELAGPTSEGAGVWVAALGPTAPYARIQELGGDTGRGHATHLPPRPYLGPAARFVLESGRLAEVFVDAWTKALTA